MKAYTQIKVLVESLFFELILYIIAITIDHVGSSDKIVRRDYIDIEPWVALSYQVVKRDGLGGR